jgi:hypothetical protein
VARPPLVGYSRQKETKSAFVQAHDLHKVLGVEFALLIRPETGDVPVSGFFVSREPKIALRKPSRRMADRRAQKEATHGYLLPCEYPVRRLQAKTRRQRAGYVLL